jgi:transposase
VTGDKTNRRDATTLAKLHRAGELTPVWVPDAAHEAMRDLVRARATARRVLGKARQHLQGFLLRHSRIYRGLRGWTMAYRRWLTTVRFDHPGCGRRPTATCLRSTLRSSGVSGTRWIGLIARCARRQARGTRREVRPEPHPRPGPGRP